LEHSASKPRQNILDRLERDNESHPFREPRNKKPHTPGVQQGIYKPITSWSSAQAALHILTATIDDNASDR